MYELSENKILHSRDLRCLDYYAGTLVTGGSDRVFKMFSVDAGKLEQITSLDIF